MPATRSAYADMLPKEITQVLEAKKPSDLFPSNNNRARNMYRRLVRAVHPDVNGGAPEAIEATKHLNSLWSEYESGGKPKTTATDGENKTTARPSKPKTDMREVIRNGNVAMFVKDGKERLLVKRAANKPLTSKDIAQKIGKLSKVFDGSPVVIMVPEGDAMTLMQGDGAHYMTLLRGADLPDAPHFLLSDLGKHLRGNVLHPRDAGWVLKRLLFICGALEDAGLGFKDPKSAWEAFALYPDSHLVVLFDTDALTKTGANATSKSIRNAMLNPFADVIGDDWQSRKMAAFARGSAVDTRTSIGALLREFDETLEDTFGGIRFHVMEYVA